MSTEQSRPASEQAASGAQELAQPPASGPTLPGQPLISGSPLPLDPQQQFREYARPAQTAPGAPRMPPATPVPQGWPPIAQTGAFPLVAQPGRPTQLSMPVQPGAFPPAAQPGYSGYAGPMYGQPGTPASYPYAQYPGYPAYPGYQWVLPPQKPLRDGYTLAMGIGAFICSILTLLGGLVSGLFVLLVDLAHMSGSSQMKEDTFFQAMVLLVALTLVGLVGGSFGLLHSIRSLFLRRPSGLARWPAFWIFLLSYLVTLGLSFWFHASGQDTSPGALRALLIYLDALFPALTVLTLGLRRMSLPRRNLRKKGARRSRQWPTTWRRWTLALLSGATLAVALAGLLETLLERLLLGSADTLVTKYISDPTMGDPPRDVQVLILILSAVIAPLVEELVKPLAVVVLIRRVRSRAEAFALGLACGIGFNLIETTGYIASPGQDSGGWLTIALLRSEAGLLHGLGAGMMALAWYLLTHPSETPLRKRLLLTLACASYAVFQHALWNSITGLTLLPEPISSFFENWSWTVAGFPVSAFLLVILTEAIAMLCVFLIVTGQLRPRPPLPDPQ